MCSIFIVSRTTRVWPAETVSPSATGSRTTEPGIGAVSDPGGFRVLVDEAWRQPQGGVAGDRVEVGNIAVEDDIISAAHPVDAQHHPLATALDNLDVGQRLVVDLQAGPCRT